MIRKNSSTRKRSKSNKSSSTRLSKAMKKADTSILMQAYVEMEKNNVSEESFDELIALARSHGIDVRNSESVLEDSAKITEEGIKLTEEGLYEVQKVIKELADRMSRNPTPKTSVKTKKINIMKSGRGESAEYINSGKSARVNYRPVQPTTPPVNDIPVDDIPVDDIDDIGKEIGKHGGKHGHKIVKHSKIVTKTTKTARTGKKIGKYSKHAKKLKRHRKK